MNDVRWIVNELLITYVTSNISVSVYICLYHIGGPWSNDARLTLLLDFLANSVQGDLVLLGDIYENVREIDWGVFSCFARLIFAYIEIKF